MNNKKFFGKDNSNYKHGKTVKGYKDLCVCGREKDVRAKQCSLCAHRGYPKEKEKFREEQLKLIIENIQHHNSFLELSKVIGVPRKTIKIITDTYNIEIGHFKPCAQRPTSFEDIFKNDGGVRSGKVKNYIIKHNILEYKCDICGLNGERMGNKLTLHLDHKDGVCGNNTIENLRFLCPNCHEQTDTNKGKNKKYH